MKSIKSILLALLAVALTAVVALSASSWWSGQNMLAQARKVFVAKDVTADILPPPLYLIEARLTVSQALDGTMTPASAIQSFDKLADDYSKRVEFWRKNPPFGLEQYLLGEQDTAGRRFIQSARHDVLEPLVAGDVQRARDALPAVQKLYEAHRAAVDKTVEVSTAFADRNSEKFDEDEASSRKLSVGVFVGALAACVALYLVARRRLQVSVATPLNHACQAAERIAGGDLSGAIHVQGRDEAALLLKSLAAMQAGLQGIVGQMRTSADSIATASSQIASGNIDLSQRTEEQASNLQQTAASMEQLTATVKHNAETAHAASEIAVRASSVAEHGGGLVGQVVATMDQISASSKKIADIIGVIDGIAFQTNILALNAAVEAARAGEQGRGFAVVATEVRALARRSADAAKEIKSLIGAGVQGVEAGTNLVSGAGKTMSEIVDQVKRVSDLIGQISAASNEQSTGIGQVAGAVAQLDQVTQQNAALVEESAAATESLQNQAQQLAAIVGTFKL